MKGVRLGMQFLSYASGVVGGNGVRVMFGAGGVMAIGRLRLRLWCESSSRVMKKDG